MKKTGRFSPPPEYSIVNGVRYVKPYVHEFKTFAKGRWLGRELIEVLTTEFGGHEPSYWNNAVDSGFVLINGQKVPRNYVFQNSGASIYSSFNQLLAHFSNY
jgi:tRNA pseudouridine synthase 9